MNLNLKSHTGPLTRTFRRSKTIWLPSLQRPVKTLLTKSPPSRQLYAQNMHNARPTSLKTMLLDMRPNARTHAQAPSPPPPCNGLEPGPDQPPPNTNCMHPPGHPHPQSR